MSRAAVSVKPRERKELAVIAPSGTVIPAVAASSLVSLAVLGAVAASAGGAGRLRGAVRVTFRSALAMGLTALVGRVVGTTV